MFALYYRFALPVTTSAPRLSKSNIGRQHNSPMQCAVKTLPDPRSPGELQKGIQ